MMVSSDRARVVGINHVILEAMGMGHLEKSDDAIRQLEEKGLT